MERGQFVSTNPREENEFELMAIILNQHHTVDLLQIKPKYFYNKEVSKTLGYCIECYKKYKTICHAEILRIHNDFDINLYYNLMYQTIYFESSWKEQFPILQENILNYYKEDIIENLDKKLKNKEIDYQTFIEKIKKVESYKINNSNNNSMLTVSDINTDIEEIEERILSNTYKLDDAIKGFTIGQLSVWSGGNASAKSTYLNQIAIEAIQQGYNVAIYSGELVAKRLLKWIIMQCAGKSNMSYNKQKDYWFVNSYAKEKILEWLDNRLFIYDNDRGNKAKEVIRSIKDCVNKNDVKVVILDNLMSMNLSGYGDNKYDIQSEFIKDLSALAKELNVHIHFVCHPRKSTTFLRKTDISGSADLTNIADNVFIMHRVNNDFRIKTKEMFKWGDDNSMYQYSNVLEVCKNRDFGVEDYFVGMYFEPESKRLLNLKDEKRKYIWEFNNASNSKG